MRVTLALRDDKHLVVSAFPVEGAENIVVHRTNGDRGWSITHKPTGRALLHGLSSKETAQAAAQRLLAACPWIDEITTSEQIEKDIRRHDVVAWVQTENRLLDEQYEVECKRKAEALVKARAVRKAKLDEGTYD